MDSLPPLQTAFLFIIPLLLLYGVVSQHRRKLPYPPGPRGLPMIGNMLMMDQFTHRGLTNLARKYGGLFHMKLGFSHVVSVSCPEIAKQVLQVQDHIFSNRPATIAASYLSYDRADMAFADYGPFWRQMRKLGVTKLVSRKQTESWASVRVEVDSMVKAVAANTGKAVNIGELIFTLTMNITYRAAFGSKNDGQEFSKLLGAFNLADFVPGVRWIDPQGINKRLVKARQSLDMFIDKVIDDHMQSKIEVNGCDETTTDLVDDLLAFYKEAANATGNEDLHKPIQLTKDNIKAMIMNVMFGVTETVASSIEWALTELMKNPDELVRAQQELASVVGLNRPVKEIDLEKLTFLKCTLKETLRLHPPIPVVHHVTYGDTEVGGYNIPAKTRVMINIWALGRDPNSWEDPERFRPSRILDDGAPDFKGNNFEFIPFGSGRRSCPGMNLGFYALEMTVAHLLHCFNWELPDGMNPSELDMSDVFGLTAPRSSRLVLIPSSRLLCPIV
ncbi:hypothetical protein HS088_TW01G00917 [Tripterygium wilfordii]|uniref:Cytochrome P450 n=1 Tax=Tripterygium wilfordii TaxID=458696 RepID=A0A7J7E388_TRIWF|nr:hypothetical protein HS088_TW01G00917 [Tripterygium wilfordii]